MWKIFNKFFIRLDKKPNNWEDRIVLFTGFLINSKKQSSTVKSYISTIRAVLQDNGIKLNENQYLLNSLTKACRLINDQIKARIPIQKALMLALLFQIDRHYANISQPYLKVMYWAIFSTMYFGLFMIGELTQGSHTVKARDVQLAENKKKFLFILRMSKTHWKNIKPQLIEITTFKKHQSTANEQNQTVKARTTSQLSQMRLPCLYKLLRDYINLRKKYHHPDEQFFIFADNSPVKPIHIWMCLKAMLIAGGFNHPELYCVHGIHAGRACDLLQLGLSVETIKKVRRWKSNAVYKYLR